MEFKEYQTRVLERFDDYLTTLEQKRRRAEKILEIDREENSDARLSDYPRDAWDGLNQRRILPEMRSADGSRLVAPYLTREDGFGASIPNICLKVPTGGGKTLLAAAALERLHADYFKKQSGFVLWVVPSDAIYRQTWKSLANREHPYRQILERASGGRVKMLEKEDAFNKADFQNYLCVMVLMLQSSSRKTKDTLRMFKDSGKFTDFFPEVDDAVANRALLRKVPNLEENDLSDLGYADGVVPGSLSLRQSLGNTLRLLRPAIVIDEGHRAYSDTARDTLCDFNPSFILELSATPNTGGTHQSNVFVNVPGNDLKEEEMIKLPINIINIAKGDWKHTLTEAHDKLKELRKEGEAVQARDGRYIRPILLIRVERTGKEQRDGHFVHAEDAKEYLMEKCGVLEEAIRFKTSDKDELGDMNLLSETCPVEVIITKDALREGWDCPFAYVLAILSKTTANTALTQMIGRVLRQPNGHLTSSEALNECYVFTFDQEVRKAVESVRKGLEEEGMGDLATSVRVGGSGASATPTKRITIKRREAFKNLPVILLPRVVRKDARAKGGYRMFDYERDILGEVDWESLHFSGAASFHADDADKLKRTIAKVNIEKKKGGQFDFTDTLTQDDGEIPDEGLDFAFLVRQLTDVVPNPWQGARILEEALEVLQKEMDEKRIYTNRLALIAEIKKDLRLQLFGGNEDKEKITGIAETLFREKLKSGEIEFSLMTANNPDLDWNLAETLEVELTGTEMELVRKNGSSLEKQLFELVFEKDFNSLEKNTAWYLDGAETVHWWHRIAVNQQSYGLQGWQRNRVYPDLLACVHGTKHGTYRLSVLETKGEHLKGNDDTEYKQALFDLLTEYAAHSFEAGKLLLGEEAEQITFTMLLEQNWEQKIAAVV
jgi:type III restriction enzyme